LWETSKTLKNSRLRAGLPRKWRNLKVSRQRATGRYRKTLATQVLWLLHLAASACDGAAVLSATPHEIRVSRDFVSGGKQLLKIVDNL
jgi:hypothetical protein